MKTPPFRMISSILVVALLVLCSGQSASAGFEEGLEAYLREDYATALKEFRPLAEQGNASAQLALGFIYSDGQGVPQDYKEAVKWYRKAAEQGDEAAQTNLGRMYDNGYGVSQDYVLAHMWFNIAGVSGYKMAIKNRNIVTNRMTPSQIEKAQRLAREWKPKKSK